jgi:anti-sigma factor RsiW
MRVKRISPAVHESSGDGMEHETATRNQAVERYVLGEMPLEERESFEAHFFDCPECADDVRTTVAFVANARAVLREEPLPVAKPVRNKERQGWLTWIRPVAWAPALAGVLVAIAGYESFVAMPLRRQLAAALEPRQVVTQLLRGETRAEPTQLQSEQENVLSLEVESAGKPTGYVATVVSAGSGAIAHTIPAVAPGDDQPLTIVIHARSLRPGRYTVEVRAVGGSKPGEEVGRYPFEVK